MAAFGASSVLVVATAVTFCSCRVIPAPIRGEAPEGTPFHQVNHALPMASSAVRSDPIRNTPEAVTPLHRSFHPQPPEDKHRIVSGSRGGHGFHSGHGLSSQPSARSDYKIIAEVWRGSADREGGGGVEDEPLVKTQADPGGLDKALHMRELETSVLSVDGEARATDHDGSSTAAPRFSLAGVHHLVDSKGNSSTEPSTSSGGYVPFNSLTLLKNKKPASADQRLQWPYFVTQSDSEGAQEEESGNYKQEEYLRVTPDMMENENTSQPVSGVSLLGTLAITTEPKIFNGGTMNSEHSYLNTTKLDISMNHTDTAYPNGPTGELASLESHDKVSQNTDRFYANLVNKTKYSVEGKNASVPTVYSITIPSHGVPDKAGYESSSTTVLVKNSTNTTRPVAPSPMDGGDRIVASKPFDREIDNQLSESTIAVITVPPPAITPEGIQADSAPVTKAGVIQSPVGLAAAPAPASHGFPRPSLGTPLEYPAERLESNFSIETDASQALPHTADFLHVPALETTAEEAMSLAENRNSMEVKNRTRQDDEAGAVAPSDDLEATRVDGWTGISPELQPVGTRNLAGAVGRPDEEDADLLENLQSDAVTTTKTVIHQSEVSSSGAMDDYHRPDLVSMKLGTVSFSHPLPARETHVATQSKVAMPIPTITPEATSADQAGQQRLPSSLAANPTMSSVSFIEPVWLTLAKNGTVPTTQVSKTKVRRTEEVPQNYDHLINEFLEREQEGSGLYDTSVNHDFTMVSKKDAREQPKSTTSKPSQGSTAAITTVKTGYVQPIRKQADSQSSTLHLRTNASHETHPSNASTTTKGQHLLSKSGLLDSPSTSTATNQQTPSYKSHSSRPAQLIETLDEVYDYADYYYDELNLGEGDEYQGEDLPQKPTFKPLMWPYTHYYNIKLYPNGTSEEEDHHPLFVTAKPTHTQRPTILETPLTEETKDGQYLQNIAANNSDNEVTSNIESKPALTFGDTANEDDYLYDNVVLDDAHDDNNEGATTPSPLLYTFTQFIGYTPTSTPSPEDKTKYQSAAHKPENEGVTQFLDFLIPIKQFPTRNEETTSTPATTSGSAQGLVTSSPLPTVRNTSGETAETTRSFSYSRQTSPYDSSAEFYDVWSQRRTTPSHNYPPSRTTPNHAASPGPSAPAITVLGSDQVTKPNRYGGIIETHSSYNSDPNPFDFLGLNSQPEQATLPPTTTSVQLELSIPTTPGASGLTERPPAAVSDTPASLVGGPSDFFLQALQKQGHTSFSEKPPASYPTTPFKTHPTPTVGGVSLTSSSTSAVTSGLASWQTSRPTTLFHQGTTRPRRPQPSASSVVHPVTSLYRPRPSSASLITIPSSSRFPSRPSRPSHRPLPVSSLSGTSTSSFTFSTRSPLHPRPTQAPVITKQTFEVVSNPESPSTLPVTLRPLSCVTTGSDTVCQPKPSVSASPARPQPTIVTRPELAARPPDTFLPTHARPHVVFLDKPLLDGDIKLEPHESSELPRPLLGQALHRPGQADPQPSLITTGGATVHFQTSPGPHTANNAGPDKATAHGLGIDSTPASVTVTTDAITVHKASLSPSKQTSGSSQDSGMNQPQGTTPMTPPSFHFYNTANSPRPTPDISYMNMKPYGQTAYPASYYPSHQGTYDGSSHGSGPSTYPSASPNDSPSTLPPQAEPTLTTLAQTSTDTTQPPTTLTKVTTTTVSPPLAVHPVSYDEGTDLHLNSHREPTEQQSYAVVNVWKKVSGELKLIGQQLVPVDQVLGTELGNGEMLDANQLPGHIISQLADALNLTSIRDSFSQTTELDPAYDVSVMTTASPVMTTSSYESYTESEENVNKLPVDVDDPPSPTTSSYVSYNGAGHQAMVQPEEFQTAPNSNNNFDNQFDMKPGLSRPHPSQGSSLDGLFAAPTNHGFFGPTEPPVTPMRHPDTNYYDSLLFKFTSRPGSGSREPATTNPPQQSEQDIPAEAQFSGTHQDGILYNLPGFQDFIQGQLFTNPPTSTRKPEPVAAENFAEVPKPTESSYLSYEAPWLSTTKTPAPNHSKHPLVNFNHHVTRPLTPEIMNLLQSMQANSPPGSQNQDVIAAVTNASLSMLPDEILRILRELKKNPDRGNLTLLSLFGGQEEGSLQFNGANVGVTKGTLGIQINQLNVSQASGEIATTPSYSNEETYTDSPPSDQGKVVSGILDLLRPDRSTTSRAMFTQAPDEPGKGITHRPSDTMLLLQALKLKPLYSRSSSTTTPGPYMNLHPIGDATPLRLSQFVPNLPSQQPDVVDQRNETDAGNSSNDLQHEHVSDPNVADNLYGSHVDGPYKINTKVLEQLQHALSHIMTEPSTHQETTQRTSTPRYIPPNPPLQTSGTYSYHYNPMPPPPPPPLQVISSESQSMLQTLGDRLGIENPQLLAAIVLSILPTVALAMPVLGRRRRSTHNEAEYPNETLLSELSGGPGGTQDIMSNNIEKMLHASEESDPVVRATKAVSDASRRGRSGGRIDLDSIQLIGMDVQAEIRDKHPSLYSQFEQFGQRIKDQLVKIDPEELRTETVHQEQAKLTSSEDWREDYEAGKVVDMRKHSEKLVSWLLRVLTVPAAYDNNLRQELLGREITNRR